MMKAARIGRFYTFAMLVASSPAFAQSVDRAEVEKIVREYILQNPEIIEDALTELETRAQATQAQARSQAILAEADALLRSGDDVILGNPDGDVTLVEFFDFNCGYCKRAAPDVKALVAEDSKLRIVLKDFPILGPGSVEAAKVALAVKRLEGNAKARDFHVRLMEMQGQINAGRALDLAEDMGLDRKRISEEMATPAIEAIISTNLALAQRLGLTGTPSFIAGDQIIQGAVGKKPLADAIETARQK
ncbi:DsbA family protein [Manganibacter manganicus]|uniref:Disulfide bond formation protein DsbA n=1 Tax=Manganibacter manganicus TaxID=1873176 RepID=A0A1V8RR14_9HYPH|nr:DsbA family protein [Pseudaminobacter manganicus]OQM75652.1 disulfide bond formation protein DsbA [Pseudaminobacter manganicus]